MIETIERLGEGRLVSTTLWHRFAHHLVAIQWAPLGFPERARCYATFVASWTRVWWRRLRRELAGLPAELRAARRPAA